MRKLLLTLLYIPISFASQTDIIEISGNSRTDNSIILTELQDLYEDKKLSDNEVKELSRRLWNLRLFSKVEIQRNKSTINIHVQERWTTIPIAKFSSGGGSEYKALGVYDINVLGTNTELGVQYETLNDKPAGVVWVRKPQFLNNRNLKFGADLWSINRSTQIYEPNSTDEFGAYTLQRKKISTFIEYKWNQDFFLFGVNYTYHQDETSDFGLSDKFLNLNQNNSYDPHSSNINRWHTVYFDIGRVNYKNYLQEGTKLSLKSSLIKITNKNESELTENELAIQYFKLFNTHHNFAWNIKIKANNFEDLYLKTTLGGLSEIRGYQDSQFVGNITVQNNIEYRMNLYEHKWGVIQGTVFSDQAKEGEDFKAITDGDEDVLLSSGVGIRLINPRIYRFVGRIDYAQTHTRSIQRGVSFGVQQFF